jgi:glycosyltransferase involved in cell wall biosynthesis
MDVVMGNSSFVVQQLLLEEKSPIERTGLIYNGVSPIVHSTSTQTELRDELNLSEKECVFTIVANLIPYKGHVDLIEAFKIVANRATQNWKLLIVGRDDGIGNYLRALVVEANLMQNITFLNARADARAILSVSNVGLLVSHEEGFSNAILEGMAEGLPMIVTDVGGNREAVDDEKTGLVIEARNPEALARSIMQLLENPSVRIEMGKKAKKRAFEKFSLARCVDQYDRLYTSLFSTNGQYKLNELLRDTDRMTN